jgi:cell wall-associated NlpC family hydrolase
MVTAPIADLRASPDPAAELVDQVHYHEQPRVLGSRDGWHFVQAEDHYFGWIVAEAIRVVPALPQWRVVSVALAPVRRDPDASSPAIGSLAAGSPLSLTYPSPEGPWARAELNTTVGYVSLDDTVVIADLPHRSPTPDDLIATAEAFLDVPYLWGGTTALGIDCSGYVQQVYRLNGVRLDRDAHQQAVEGRPVDVPARGDLIFFGESDVTHVGIALDERTFLNAPEAGKKVQLDDLVGDGRNVLAVRRYLP